MPCRACGIVSACERACVELSDDVATLPVAEVAQSAVGPGVPGAPAGPRRSAARRCGATARSCVPADFLDDDGAVVKGLSGHDHACCATAATPTPDILRWLFAEDDSLPGTPIASLRAGRHREVKRRAQAMAF